MSRRLSLAAMVLLAAGASVARADAPGSTAGTPATPPGDELGDQSIGAEAGIATGGRSTPGGLRLAGHYLYQLSDQDWFDGGASFTFGGGGAACFRDRSNSYLCDHGLADGDEAEITATVRRFFAAQGQFRPFARAGLGVGIVRFGADGVTGLAIPLHAGGGVRVQLSEDLAIVAQAEVVLGFGLFNKSLGAEPQLGTAITAGVEFRLW